MKEKIRSLRNHDMKERSESIFEGISNGRKKALINWFNDQWMKIEYIKKLLILANETEDSLQDILLWSIEQYNTFVEVFVVDENGIVIASSFRRHIGDSIKDFPNLKKGLDGENYMYGPYSDRKILDLDLSNKQFYDDVTLLFSAPYMNKMKRLLCIRVLNDDMSDIIQEEDTHVFKDSGDNYLFMIENNRGIQPGTAISRSRFEDKTFTLGDNLKDGIETKKWGTIKITNHTEFEIIFNDPATKTLHKGISNTIKNKENLECLPGYPDYRHILVGGKGTIIKPPHSDEVWGMMCEADISDIYHFSSLSTKVPFQIGAIVATTIILSKLLYKYFGGISVIGDITVWLVMLLSTYFITKHAIVKPLTNTIVILRSIAEGEGDLTKRVSHQTSNEIGELARWFNKFISNQMNMIKRIDNSIKTTKNTTKQVSTSSKKIEESIDTIEQTVTTLSENSFVQNKLFKDTQIEVKKVLDTYKQNSQLETLIDEIKNKTSITSEAATSASDIKEDVMSTISELETSMESAILSITSLENKSNEITKIIHTISEISDQTSLVALNATIEAARAGEIGKGFYVVAEEIKKLSTGTSDATLMIKELITSIQNEIKDTNHNIKMIDEKVKASVKSSRESAKAVELVVSISNTISYILNIMSEQNKVTKDVYENICDMEKRSEKNTKIGENNSKLALTLAKDIMIQIEKLNHVIESLEYSADDLDRLVGDFRIQ